LQKAQSCCACKSPQGWSDSAAFLENTDSQQQVSGINLRGRHFLPRLLPRTSMPDRIEDQAYLVFVDRHIEELEERINALRERMAKMALQSYETQNQQALLSSMLQVRDDMEKFRLELIEAFNTKYSDT
jgi:hypothetical protein